MLAKKWEALQLPSSGRKKVKTMMKNLLTTDLMPKSHAGKKNATTVTESDTLQEIVAALNVETPAPDRPVETTETGLIQEIEVAVMTEEGLLPQGTEKEARKEMIETGIIHQSVTTETTATEDHLFVEDLLRRTHAVSKYLDLIFAVDAEERRDRRRSRSGGKHEERNPSAGRSPELKIRDVKVEGKVDSFVSNGGGNEGTDVDRKQ